MNIAQSLGAKLTLVCLIVLAVLAIGAASINYLWVRALKDNIAEDSRRLAIFHADQVARELVRLQAESGSIENASDEARAEFRERINSLFRSNDNTLWAGVVEVVGDGRINILFGDYRDDQARSEILKVSGRYEIALEPNENEALSVVLKSEADDLPVVMRPLEEGERPELRLAMALSENEIYKRIQSVGSEITRRVGKMTILLSAAVIMAFFAVWGLLRGQMRLFRENEKLSRMAYVGTLASGLAHEIRNPLNAMSVNLGVIEEDLEDPREDSQARVGQVVKHLQTEIGQLDKAVKNFLAFALPASTKRETVSLAETAREAAQSLERQIAERRVEVDWDLDESLRIVGDPTGLHQVLHNLMLNAVQAMTGARRQLGVRAWRENGHAAIEVRDTGEGMDAEAMKRIFDVFHSTKPGGSGFGLSIAQRIVSDHRGSIRVESKPGEGSAFRLEFPLPAS